MDEVTPQKQATRDDVPELHGDTETQSPTAETKHELHGDGVASSPTADADEATEGSSFPLDD